MNSDRWICLSGLILCLAVGGALRLIGADWGSGAPRSHRGMYAHPDERSVYDKTGRLVWKRVDRNVDESRFAWVKRIYSENFLDPNSGMNLDSYNYGSFPYYVLFGVSNLFNAYSPTEAKRKILYGSAAILLWAVIGWATLFLLAAGRPERQPSVTRTAAFTVGVAFFAVAAAILAGDAFTKGTGTPWAYQNWGKLARPISGAAGALTIFYIYRTGARLYSRRVGLFAAILLTFTALHIQLSHYYTFDVLQALFCTAAVYSLLVFVDSQTWGGRWRSILAASVWTGVAMSTKFGSILLFIPWIAAFGLAYWRHRPKIGLHRLPSISFAAHLKLIGLTSFLLIWGVTFATQPFGYLDYAPIDRNARPASASSPSSTAKLSFVHLNFAVGPKFLPESARDVLASLGGRIDPLTSKIGVHFGWLDHLPLNPAHQDWLAIGGSRYWRDVTEQRRMALEGGFPWTRQYKNTTPFVYQWKNLIVWGMGVPLGLLCLFGLFYGFGAPFYRPTWTEWVVLAWMIPNFFSTHLFLTKFPRYLTPQLPYYCLWGAALAAACVVLLKRREAARSKNGRWRLSMLPAAACAAIVAWSALYSFAYLKVFTGTHPWETASDWFQEEVPRGKRLVSETWDDPVPVDPGVMRLYEHRAANPIHSDSPQHLLTVFRQMEWADYYCFASKRNYGAFLQAPEDGPNRVRFYKSLFAGNLGYRLVKTFSQPVTVLGVPIRFELADESLSLYDHPTVHVFEKVEDLNDQELLDRVLHPPQWVLDLEKEQILTATENRSILAPRADYPMERWLLGILAVGWLFWPIAFFLFRASPDGGIFAGKTVGMLLLTYLSWLGTNLGWWENSRLSTTFALVLWMVLSGFCLLKAGPQMIDFLRTNWRKLLLAEAVFLLVFAYFIAIRMANPDIYWGEKPMNIAFINAAYQAKTFPAVDPWYAGVPINYYHYGHFAVALFGKWVGVPPEFAYNLACGTWPALVFCLVFGIVFNLTRSKFGGLVAGFLAVAAGNVKSVIQLAAQFNGGPEDPKAFREAYQPGGLGAYFSEMFDQIALSMGQVGWVFWKSPLFERVGAAFGAWLDPAVVEAAKAGQLHRVLSFDAYFWKLSRITKSSVANEFPGWTHFFADLHAHQIGMPIAMVSLALIVAFFQRKVGMWRLAGAGRFSESHALYGSSMVCLLQTLSLSLFLGIVFVSNAWDYPGLIGFFSLALALLFFLYYRDWLLSVRWGFGRSILRMNVGGVSMRRFACMKLGFLREVFLPVLAVGVLGYAFLYPFHRHFHPPKRVGGIGWMHEAASGWTTPYEFVQIFGFFMILILFGSLTLYWRWAGSPHRNGFGMIGTILAGGLIAVASARYLRGLAAKVAGIDPEAPIPRNRDSLVFWRMLDAEIAYLVFGFVFFLLLLLIPFLLGRRSNLNTRLGTMVLGLGLAVIAGVEVVYIDENWSAPLHRWNTAFKFHLQAWLCLSVGVGWLLGTWWNRPDDEPPVLFRASGRFFRYAFGYPILLFTLTLAAAYPMAAPFVFTHGDGFSFRTRHVERDFTLDGLNFMRKNHPDYAAVIDYLRAAVDGQQTIVEVEGESYSHDRGWTATHTGLPTLIGWPHHSRERDNLPEPRIELVKTIYSSTSRERVRDILRDHRVRYVVLGPTERRFHPNEQGLEKFEDWKDLFHPVFTSKYEDPGVTLYAVHPLYRLDEDWAPPEKAPEESTHFRKETGRTLLRGGPGYGGGEYREPRGIAMSPEGGVIVADSMNHRIQAFDPAGALLWTLGEEGSEPGEFKEPRDVALDEEGRTFVLDTWNSRIQIFTATGELAGVHPIPGGANGVAVGRIPIAVPDEDSGRLTLPEAPPLGAPMIFVANTAGRNVVVLNRKGEQTQTWGSGALQEPVDVEPTPMGLAVADPRARRILLYDGRGRPLQEWEIPTGETGGQTNEMKLFWDAPRERLFVTDPAHNRVFVFSRDGKVLLESPVQGGPAGAAVARDGRVFIAARGEGRMLLVPVPTDH